MLHKLLVVMKGLTTYLPNCHLIFCSGFVIETLGLFYIHFYVELHNQDNKGL